MNALTMGSYAAIAIIGFLVLLKLYKLVKAEGARQQGRKDKEMFNEERAELADKLFNRPDPFKLRAKLSKWRIVKARKL